MKKFHFPFQRAKDWRERLAEQEKTELERLNNIRTQIQESRHQLSDDLQALSRGSHQPVTTAENLHQLAAFTRNLQVLDGRLKAEETRCAGEIVRQQDRCTQADRDARLLSHLYDRNKRVWEYEAARELEQVATDNWNASYSRQLNREPGNTE